MRTENRYDSAPPAASAAPSGFGIVELLVAITILAFVVLGMGSATARLSQVTYAGADRLNAAALVEERVGLILIDPVYDSLEVRYAGTQTDLPGLPGATMKTAIRRTRQTQTGGRVLDYTVVTVTVQSPHLKAPVSRTVTVSPR